MGTGAADVGEPAGRWRILAILAVGLLLAMSPWLSAAAVVPAIRAEWSLSVAAVPWLTIAVQLGFAAGALVLAATAAADVLPAPIVFLGGAVIAALANLGFAFIATDLVTALPFRVATGAALAGVYPVAMKLIVGWFRDDRGLAIGVLIGALTVGSALPYLLSGLSASAGVDWRVVVAMASPMALVGAVLVAIGTRPGPFDVRAPRFSPAVAARALRDPAVRLANLGYLGHMWELYGMWTWIPLFLAASFLAAGVTDPAVSGLASFAVVAAGGIGCVGAGLVADRWGRTTVTMGAMAISGTSALAAAVLFGASPLLVVLVCLVWGTTVVADSAQFSAAVTELSPPGTAGSALALQVSAGFVLTSVTILVAGTLGLEAGGAGWRVAFAVLALGPALGILAMWRLRGRPEAIRLAGGRR